MIARGAQRDWLTPHLASDGEEILEAIAAGATCVSEIAGEIRWEASSLSRYLQNLTRIGLVERETPVTDPDGRGADRTIGHSLRFWFRYVLPNRATLER